jgi:ABC-type branched-subunit amino acid transport system substrate-binding protein
VIGKLESAYFDMINEQGGIGGWKINFISLDDGCIPPTTVDQVIRLAELDPATPLFSNLGHAHRQPADGAGSGTMRKRFLA